MNRSKVEIEKMEQMLESGQEPDLYNLLLLDAKNSFNNRNHALAVVQSFQALEIFLENFLVEGLQSRAKLTEQASKDYVSTGENWRTKIRLKDVLKKVTGFTLAEKNQDLWNKWCNSYSTVRNKVIHEGKNVNNVETKEVLENNFKVIELLKTL